MILTDESINGEFNQRLLRIELKLYKFTLEEDQQLKHVIDLEEIDNSLKGKLQLTFFYDLQRKSPLQSLSKTLRILNSSLNLLKNPFIKEKPLSFRLYLQFTKLKFEKNPDFFSLEVLSSEKDQKYLIPNSLFGPEIHNPFTLIAKAPFKPFYVKLVLYERKETTRQVFDVLLCEFDWKKWLLESPGWNHLSLSFLSNQSPLRNTLNTIGIKLRIEGNPFVKSLIRLNLGQIRTFGSTIPFKKLWTQNQAYYLKVWTQDFSQQALYKGSFKPVEPIRKALFLEENDFGKGIIAKDLEGELQAFDIKVQVPSFEGEFSFIVDSLEEMVFFTVYTSQNEDLNLKNPVTLKDLRDKQNVGVSIELRGVLEVSSLINLMKTEGKDSFFPVKLQREGINNKKPVLEVEDEEDWSENLDISLLELCYLWIKPNIIELIEEKPLILEEKNDIIEFKEKALQKPDIPEIITKDLLSLRIISLENLYCKNPCIIGHLINIKKKPRLLENLSLSSLAFCSLESFSHKLTETRLSLSRFKGCFYEELQVFPIEKDNSIVYFWLLSCLMEGRSFEHLVQKSQNLIDFEEPLLTPLFLKDFPLVKGQKLTFNLPIQREDCSGSLVVEAKLKENGFIANSEGTLIISTIELQRNSSKNSFELKDFALQFSIIPFRELKFESDKDKGVLEENNTIDLVDIEAFSSNGPGKGLISYNNLILNTTQPSDCLVIKPIYKKALLKETFIKEPSKKESSIKEPIKKDPILKDLIEVNNDLQRDYRLFPIIISLNSLDLVSSDINTQKLAHERLIGGVLSDSTSITVKLTLSYQNNDDNIENQGISIEKVARWKQKLKHFHEKLHRIAYLDPISQFLYEFTPRFLSSYIEYPKEDLKKEYKEIALFLDPNKTNKPKEKLASFSYTSFKLSKGTRFILKDSFKKRSPVTFTLFLKDSKGISFTMEKVLLEKAFIEIEETRSENEDFVLETVLNIKRDYYLVFTKEEAEKTFEFELILSFMNKEGISKSEKGLIQEIKGLKEVHKVLTGLRPSNTRLYLIVETLQIEANLTCGKGYLCIHRLVFLPETKKMIDYHNVNLLHPLDIKEKGVNKPDFLLELRFEINGLCIKTSSISKEGLLEEPLEVKGFYYRSLNQLFRISLYLCNPIPLTKENSLDSVLLSSMEVPLYFLVRNSCKGYYAFELIEAISPEKDLLNEFIIEFNRNKLFLLGSFIKEETLWKRVWIGLEEISGFSLEIGYYGVKIEVFYMKGETLIKAASFESEFIQFTKEKQGEKESKIPFSKENCFEFLYEEFEGLEGYFAFVRIEELKEETTQIICSRYIPLKSFISDEIKDYKSFLCDFPGVSNEVSLLLSIKTTQNFIENNMCENEGLNVRNEDFSLSKPNFRTNNILDILNGLLNTNSIEILIVILKEINEYLLFAKEIECFEKVFELMTQILCIYHENTLISLITLQNMYNLISSNPEKAFILAFKGDFPAILLFFLSEIKAKPTDMDKNNPFELEEKGFYKDKDLENSENIKKPFDLITITAEKMVLMASKELRSRLYQNYKVRRDSLIGITKDLKGIILEENDLYKVISYILKISEHFIKEKTFLKGILSLILRFTPFLLRKTDLAGIFLDLSYKTLVIVEKELKKETFNEKSFLYKVLDMICAIIKDPTLSARQEDLYLQRGDKFFELGDKKGVQWTKTQQLSFILALFEGVLTYIS